MTIWNEQSRTHWALSEDWDSLNQEKDLSHPDQIYYEHAQVLWHERLCFKIYSHEEQNSARY